MTSDPDAASKFYSGVLGVAEQGCGWCGYVGVADVDRSIASITKAGGMLNDPDAKHPHWLYYFRVEDFAAAQQRISANGGWIRPEPQQIPGGRFARTPGPRLRVQAAHRGARNGWVRVRRDVGSSR